MNKFLNKCESCGNWYQIFIDGSLFVCNSCIYREDEIEVINDDYDYQPSYAPKVWERSDRRKR